jgi:hypothetical protein
LVYHVDTRAWSSALQEEQTAPEVLRLGINEDWQKQETQDEESAAWVQVSWAA